MDVTRYRPRKAPGLPPGQRLLDVMPRFSDVPLRPPPQLPVEPTLEVTQDGTPRTVLTGDDLRAVGQREQQADFHCVTTWSVAGLRWTGVPLREVLASVGVTEETAPYLVARAADGSRAALTWEDATADDVLLATHLNGAPLDVRHGAPLRLVSPRQYGYKNLKHLVSIDLRSTRPKPASKEHLRARVALQERHPRLPSWSVLRFYRLLIAPTAYLSERSLRRYEDAGATRSTEPRPALARTAAASGAALLWGVAAVHAYWALGGRWPGTDDASLAQRVVGDTDQFPSSAATWSVVVVLASAGVPMLDRSGVPTGLPCGAVRWGLRLIGAGTAARGVGGAVTSAVALARGSTTPYHRLDLAAYSPLCFALSALAATAVRDSRVSRR